MKHLKHFFCLFLFAAGWLLFAEGSQEQEINSSGALDPVGLSWYYFGTDPGSGLSQVEEAMGEYLKESLNVTVKFYPLGWDEFIQKTGAKFASNEPMDIVFSPVWINFYENVARNAYLDITDLFPEYCPETNRLIGDDFLRGGMMDGKLYAIPTNKEKALANGLLFNKSIIDKYNLKIDNVKTINDLEALFQVVKQNEPDIIPFLATSVGSGWDKWFNHFPIVGDDVIPIRGELGNNKLFVIYDKPEYKESMNVMKRFYDKGYLPADAPLMEVSEVNSIIENGGAFAVPVGLRPGTGAERSNERVTYVEHYMSKVLMTNKDLGGSMNSISRTSRNPERALMFLEEMNTDPVLNNILAFGVEGVHYDRISGETIKLRPDSSYAHTWQWAFANQFLNYLKDNEDPRRWEKMENFNKEAIAVPSLGFNYDMGKWKSQLPAIKMIISEQYLGLGIGDAESELPILRNDLTKAGLYDILADIQKEYDAWLESK